MKQTLPHHHCVHHTRANKERLSEERLESSQEVDKALYKHTITITIPYKVIHLIQHYHNQLYNSVDKMLLSPYNKMYYRRYYILATAFQILHLRYFFFDAFKISDITLFRYISRYYISKYYKY